MCNISHEWINTFASIGAAIGTVAAVVVALNNSDEEKKIRLENEKKAQASKIAGWVGGLCPISYSDEQYSTITLINKSDLPIYKIVARPGIHLGSQHNKVSEYHQNLCGKIHLLPPGESMILVSYLDSPMGGKAMMLELGFQDAFGINWKRRGDGILEEIPEDPFTYFGIERPFGENSLYEILPLSKKMDDDYRRIQFYISSIVRMVNNLKLTYKTDNNSITYLGLDALMFLTTRPYHFLRPPTQDALMLLEELNNLLNVILKLQELVRTSIDSTVLREVVYFELGKTFDEIEKLQASIRTINPLEQILIDIASFSDFSFRYFRRY